MKNMNCVNTMPEIMPEITDEAIIEALFAQRPYEEKVINSAFLEIPAEYQRKLNIPNVEKMSAEFTELIANPPKVSYRDGHYFVFDGQHTIVTRRAMNGGQDLPIICKVYEGLTEEEEAMLFSRQTGVSTPLTAGAELRAALVGKDPESLAFVKATESTGLQLGLDSYRAPWKIICIRTAFKEYKTYGADLYKEALTMLAKGWEGDPDSLRSGILQGMVRFVALYQGEYDPERLVKRLHTVHPMTLVNDEKSLSGTVSYKYMMLILRTYNGASPSSSDILAFLGILLFPARAACQKRAALATYRRIGGLIAIIPKDWKYLRGDIYYADMEPHIGSEQGGTRPVVVLQNDVGNRYAPTLIVATVTSRTEKKRYQPTHVLIAHNTAFEKPSVVQLEQIFTIDKSRIQRFLGQTTRHEMRRIEEALMNSLEINEWDRRNANE